MELKAYERAHLERMQALAPECTLFLQKNGEFPLAQPGKIAIYGSGARRTVKGGTGSGDVNSRFALTAEQGLMGAGFTVTTKAWLDGYDAVVSHAHEAFIADIKRRAKAQHVNPMIFGMGAVMPEPEYDLPLDGEGDIALYILARNSGEGNDRENQPGDVKLTATEIRDILACREKYGKFMLVLNVGGPVDLRPVEAVENILLLSQLGAVTGGVLADVVLGRENPSGKLTTTWHDQAPAVGNFGDPDDVFYREGIYVGYRYFDAVGTKTRYPFGFGLSYTEFSLGESRTALDGTVVSVTVPVKNIGSMPGREVVQVYVSLPWGRLDQPVKTLAGFGKTGLLAPGGVEEVTVTFRMEDLAGFDTDSASYILEPGSYILRVGSSSADTKPVSRLTLGETVTVRKVSHVGGVPSFADWKPSRPAAEEVSGLPELTMEPAAFAALSWPKPHRASVEARKKAASLPDDMLIRACMGSFQQGFQGFASIIGDASCQVAGAAGESTGKLRNVPSLVMADGPAGLRLATHYTRDEKGARAVGSTLPAGFEELMGKGITSILKGLQGKPKGQILEQYCTAIPIGTALAQSWNRALWEACGDMVGDEMERFGVDLWLAPAFNIHRSILCGRNFEYYSEDPLVSGLAAAAITRGVQKHPGRGTTVKHFCCNNQERNRYSCNSHVSERALREIYIKGFQICIRESNPAALMTSYNLLNGVHTSQRSDLMRDLVRGEWGYEGLIMTDWVVSMMAGRTKYPMAKSAPTIAAGNDVFMPGSAADFKLALAALKGHSREYTLTRAEAEYCAAHLIDTAWKLKGRPKPAR